MKKQTQKERILQHLKEEKSITAWEAIKEYGCTRLADVIFCLKRDYSISSEMVDGTNRFGDKVRFAKYTFIGTKTLN